MSLPLSIEELILRITLTLQGLQAGCGCAIISTLPPCCPYMPVYARFDGTGSVNENDEVEIPEDSSYQVEYSFPSIVTQIPLEDKELIQLDWLNQEK